MMTFFKLVLFDIYNGIVKRWRYVLLFFLVTLMTNVILYIKWQNLGVDIPEALSERLTFGDYILYPMAGIREYVPDSGMPIVVPALWLFIVLLTAYVTLHYADDDLHGFGVNTLVLSQKRIYWWLSKCCWLFCSILVYVAVMCVSSLLFVWISGGVISTQISQTMPQILELNPRELVDAPWDITGALCLFPLTVFAVCLIQTLLSLYIRPLLSFVVSAVILLMSAYAQNPWLIGNYAMTVRTDIFVEHTPVSVSAGLMIVPLICVAAVACGVFRINRMDIINREA